MNLSQLKNIYTAKNNITAVNQINQIENIYIKTGISYNKIIQYLLSICTSKNSKKILNLLQSYFPAQSQLTDLDIQKILNKDNIKKIIEKTKINNIPEIPKETVNINKEIKEEIKNNINTKQPKKKKQENLNDFETPISATIISGSITKN